MTEDVKVAVDNSRSDVAAAFDKAETTQTSIEPVKADPAKVEPAKVEPVKVEPVKIEPAKVEPITLRGEGEVKEPVKAVEPIKADEVKVGEVKSDEAKWQDRLTKAPSSWKPEARESWAQLPSNVRVEIHRRESEVYKVLQHSKEAREFHQDFQKVAQPYAMLIAQDGGNPLHTFNEYLKTSSLLRMGTPHEKAMAVARAINQFQVPIELLDSALAGTLKPGNGSAGTAEFRDPRVDQLLATINGQQAQREQQTAEEVDTELQEFASDEKNKYFNDVRDFMADIMEVAARRNKKIGLQTAYNQAIMLHPEISKLVKAQETVQTEQKLTQAAQAAKAAAISVTGSPGAPGGASASDGSIRSSIEAAISQLSGR